MKKIHKICSILTLGALMLNCQPVLAKGSVTSRAIDYTYGYDFTLSATCLATY